MKNNPDASAEQGNTHHKAAHGFTHEIGHCLPKLLCMGDRVLFT